MSNIEALKEKARRHEQKEEWQEACEAYIRAIERLDEEEQPDIGLYNRVGDLLIRVGDYERAVEHFERATDLYLEAELPNNAIAVCKKVARHLPNRHEVHLRIGQIRASQGFLLDARDSFLTYAEKKQSDGDTDEALRALVEFVELAPEDTDARLALAGQLVQHERTDEAMEQLRAGLRTRVAAEDEAGAKVFEERILELDPEADLEAIRASASKGEGGEFAFESTDLGGFGALSEPEGDAQEPDEAFEVEADFGEIVIGGEESADGGEVATEAAAATEPVFEGSFGEIALGGAEETEEDAVELADAGDVVGDFDFSATDKGADAGAEIEVASEFDEDEDVVELPFMTLGDDGDAETPEDAVELPLIDDLMAGLEDEPADEEEEAEPLPFLSMGDAEDGKEAAEPQATPPSGDELLEVSAALEAALEESFADSLTPPVEPEGAEVGAPSLGEEADREAWERLRGAAEGAVTDVDVRQRLVEAAFKLNDTGTLVDSYLLLAEALRETGDLERAGSVLQQVLSLDPANTRALEWLEGVEGATSQEGGSGDSEGYVDLGSLIFDDDDAEKTTRFRVAYEAPTGDEDADFARMLSQFKAKVAENFDASDVKAHHDLGTAYKEMGLLDEAVEKFQEALRASPVHLPTYELLGQTFMDKGEHAAAIRVLQRALKVGSEVEDEFLGIYYYLGRAYEETGDTGQALEYYDRVFALDINFRDVTERLRRLR